MSVAAFGEGDRKGARQLVLDLGHTPSFAPDDFLDSASNADAHAMIDRWPDWPDRMLVLVGPPGCGKSHLGAMWAARVGARVTRMVEPLEPECGSRALVIEDWDRACRAEAALFHIVNLARDGGGWLLVTARVPPAQWEVRTPDLLSRLRLAPMIAIGRPDEPLIRAVIVKLFADRQIRIEEDVVTYASRHCDQSLDAIRRFVAAVDEESLAAGRRITRALAAQTVASLQRERPALE